MDRMSDKVNLEEPVLSHVPPTLRKSSVSMGISRKRKRELNSDPKKNAIKKSVKLKAPEVSETPDQEDLDLTLGVNKAFAHMDNHLLADYMARRTRKFEKELCSIELEDKYVSATSIMNTSSWGKLRDLDSLPAFLENFSKNPSKLWSASKKNGAPHTVIVAGSGIRAADLARVVRKFQTKDATVAKLFAKHIKLKDSVNFLKTTRTGMAVGTPKRLSDLVKDGSLAVDKLERIVIDASHIDQKKRGVIEMKETQIPLAELLNRPELKERLGQAEKGIDLIFY